MHRPTAESAVALGRLQAVKSMYHRGTASEDMHVYTNRHMMQLCSSANANTSCTDAFLFTWRSSLQASRQADARASCFRIEPPLSCIVPDIMLE